MSKELEDKQQRGHVLNANQHQKLKQKQKMQDKLDHITNGTFVYEYHDNTNTLPQPKAKKSIKPHSVGIAPLKRHHIKRIINDNSNTLDLNEKFDKLLSRPTFSIWAVRELFAGFNHTEWQQIPTEYIRHILDAYYARNDIVFVYKILMKWFKRKMGNRYVLYSDLCKAMIDIDNMSHAIQVFEYLLYSLMTTAHTNDEDIALLLYIIYDLMNVLIPRMMSLGQFYVFDELISKLIELKENGFIGSEAMNGVFSVSNLALLWKSCVQNESLHRLLIVIKWINECKDNVDINGLFNKLERKYIETALVLAINSNNKALFIEIMNLCQYGIDIIKFDAKDSIIYCIRNGSLHCVLNEDNNWSLSSIMDLNGVILDDIAYFEAIIHSYCSGNNKLTIKSWYIICDWLLHFINISSVNTLSIINDLVYYFAVHECFESLLMDNIGDAMRWSQLIYKLICITCVEHHEDEHNKLNGIICGAQIIGYLRNFKVLSNVINHLPTHLMMIHCVDIVECCVCDGIHSLQINENGIFERIYGDDGVDIMKRAFQMIEIFDEIHAAVNITNKGWMEGENTFRDKLEDSLQNIDYKCDINVNGANPRYHNDIHCKEDKYDLKWFDALSAFAFDQK